MFFVVVLPETLCCYNRLLAMWLVMPCPPLITSALEIARKHKSWVGAAVG